MAILGPNQPPGVLRGVVDWLGVAPTGEMMRKLIFAIGALLAMAVPALAEGPATSTLVPGTLAMPAPAVDLSVSPTQLAQMPMAPMAYRWNGCYVGLNGGGIWSDAHFTWAGINEGPGAIQPGFSQVVQPA